jgi:hypothetical protein
MLSSDHRAADGNKPYHNLKILETFFGEIAAFQTDTFPEREV